MTRERVATVISKRYGTTRDFPVVVVQATKASSVARGNWLESKHVQTVVSKGPQDRVGIIFHVVGGNQRAAKESQSAIGT